MARSTRAAVVRRLAVAACALGALALAVMGCSKRESAGGGEKPVTVGVTLLTMQHQFYQELRAGLEAEAAKHGYKLLVVSAEFDAAKQADQVDEFLVQGVDAIVLCPADSRSVGASVLAANEKGVTVVTADIASASALGKVAAHIASDNVAGGREAALMMVEAIGGKGKVAILSHPEVSSVTDRVRGFREEMAKHAGVEIVGELSAEGRRDKAVRVMEDLLQSHPDLNGVFAINDDSALGALAAVESAGRAGTVAIVGYDGTPEARARIASGAIYGDVVQHPRRIGELTVEALHSLLAGREVASVIPVEVGRVTRETAKDE